MLIVIVWHSVQVNKAGGNRYQTGTRALSSRASEDALKHHRLKGETDSDSAHELYRQQDPEGPPLQHQHTRDDSCLHPPSMLLHCSSSQSTVASSKNPHETFQQTAANSSRVMSYILGSDGGNNNQTSSGGSCTSGSIGVSNSVLDMVMSADNDGRNNSSNVIPFELLDMNSCYTERNSYSCPQCGKELSDRYCFRRHYMTHTGNKPYACSICPYKATQRSDLKIHLLRKHQLELC